MKSFDFKKVSLIYGGRQISGFQNGTAITVSMDTDDWADVSGADGEVARARSNDNRGKITFTLQQTSASNQVLSDLRAADVAGTGGPLPVMLKDNQGKDLHVDDQAYIQKMPDGGYGSEIQGREWVLRCPSLSAYFGGN